jgi:hypothetical protein
MLQDTGVAPLLAEPYRFVPTPAPGRWEEGARIYAKLGAQSGVVRDTIGVSGADQTIYQFNLDGENIVRRVQPDSGQAILNIAPTGDVMTWVIGRYQGFAAVLTTNRLTLNDGLSVPHVFPKDAFPTSSQVTHVFFRVATPMSGVDERRADIYPR